MAGIQYRDPIRAIEGGTVFPGAYVHVYDEAGTTHAAIYADEDLTARLSNPLRADSSGRCPPIYTDPDEIYWIRVTDAAGNVYRSDPNISGVLQPLAYAYVDLRDADGALMPGATKAFYASGTTELETVYSDEALTTPLTNPVVANASGAFAATWLDTEREYRIVARDSAGRLIYDVQRLSLSPAAVPPSAPVLSGEIAGENINLEWTAAVSPFGTIAGYRLYNALTDALIFDTEDPDDLDYIFGPVEEGETYAFYVIGYDSNGLDSAQSNTVSFSIGVQVEIITTSRTWNKPADLLSVEIEVIGAGGGGAGGDAQRGPAQPDSGGGGGGGERRIATFAAGDISDTVAVTIGAAGAGGAGAIAIGSGIVRGAVGTDGADTSFGAYLLAKGGRHGGGARMITAGAGGTGGTGGTGTDGGAGGNGSVSNAAGSGETGYPGSATTNSGAGGGGGSPLNSFASPAPAGAGGATAEVSGGAAGTGQAISAAPGPATGTVGGAGGNDADGAGGGGGGGGCAGAQNATGDGSATAGNGGSGGNYGGGGGGGGAAQSSNSSGSVATGGSGGNGGQGVVILRYTYTS